MAGPLNEQFEDLALVVNHLRKIKDWLTQDPRMLPRVDDDISQQVPAMATRVAE